MPIKKAERHVWSIVGQIYLAGGRHFFWTRIKQIIILTNGRNFTLEHRTSMEEGVRQQQSVINLSNEHTDEIIAGFKKELYKDLVIYVEGLTPYIIRQ